MLIKLILVGGFNHFEKYYTLLHFIAEQVGSLATPLPPLFARTTGALPASAPGCQPSKPLDGPAARRSPHHTGQFFLGENVNGNKPKTRKWLQNWDESFFEVVSPNGNQDRLSTTTKKV